MGFYCLQSGHSFKNKTALLSQHRHEVQVPVKVLCKVWLYPIYFMMLVCVDALHPSQQLFSHVGMISCLPGLNQYQAEDKVSCSRTQHIPPVGLKLVTL